MPAVTERVRAEWRARIAAEYTSAAITQHLVLWLIQAGAPPDLIDAGLAIVADELVHSRMSHEVYVAAGGTLPPAIERDRARPRAPQRAARARHPARRASACSASARPSRCRCSATCASAAREPVARAALDRILRDEVRHRDFGWDLLDWLCDASTTACPRSSTPQLPAMLARARGELRRGQPDGRATTTAR